jgi:four helix bundle protein
MGIGRFEDIEAWQLARQLCGRIHERCSSGAFARDFALRDQIDRASGSVMDNIAEGFDGGSHAEFARFLSYAQRSCTEVQSQLYRALDRNHIDRSSFDQLYGETSLIRAKIGAFIKYLKQHPGRSS